ncbi:hypothetical protein LIER_04106 [Lithospermum erythrorhizon]|uniref:Uncharacterized protein n=1 Tax=Lithospermum erythrorhizon TaxID=34254 RepID=A0AAV3NVI6_LITER
MDADIPSVVDTEPVTTKAADEGVIASVSNKDTETAGNIEEPTIGRGFDDTMDANIQEVIPEDVGQKKKSKKRKYKKSADAGESFVPKKKLSKEERAGKRAHKDERKAKRAAEKAAEAEVAEHDVPEEVEEFFPKEVIPSVTQPTIDDELVA